MILDTTGREPNTTPVIRKPVRGQSDKVATGDVVEVEIVRNGKTLYKGR